MIKTVKTALKGAGMGIAEVIPGVSGGTIAFITGIYEDLMDSIKSVNGAWFKLIFTGKWKAAFEQINGTFLVKVLTGMVIGFGFGLFAVTYLLEHYPIQIWSFFFGLILASIYVVGKEIPKWTVTNLIALIAGTIFVFWITTVSPTSGSESVWMILIAGILGISALILPGLSGSFVLLLLGMYTVVMPAIKDVIKEQSPDALKIVAVFAVGAVIGLFSFAHLLSYLYKNYRTLTMATLTGFLIGSLNKVWPWQEVLSTRINSKGEEVVQFSQSVLPSKFSGLEDNFMYGNDPQLASAIGIIIAGVVIVLLLDRFGKTEPNS